jgi:hypothetical protein
MEAAGHPVASASRHQVKDGYSTTRNVSNVSSHWCCLHPAAEMAVRKMSQ